MEKPTYLKMSKLIDMIEWPQRDRCENALAAYGKAMRKPQASPAHNQVWKGGYWDHMVESMNTAVVLYELLNSLRPLKFSLSEALFVLFWYHFERLPQVEISEEFALLRKNVTSAQFNALRYLEGEGKRFDEKERRQWPLAAFLQMCDIASSRLWPSYPLAADDPWQGARRVSRRAAEDGRHNSTWICPVCGSDGRSLRRRNDAHDGFKFCVYCGICRDGLII